MVSDIDWKLVRQYHTVVSIVAVSCRSLFSAVNMWSCVLNILPSLRGETCFSLRLRGHECQLLTRGDISQLKSTLILLMCVLSFASLYWLTSVLSSHPNISLILSCFVIFILALAFTLVFMSCVTVLIVQQIISLSHLRSFSASASSFFTVLVNLIRANPDVLVRGEKTGFCWQ